MPSKFITGERKKQTTQLKTLKIPITFFFLLKLLIYIFFLHFKKKGLKIVFNALYLQDRRKLIFY